MRMEKFKEQRATYEQSMDFYSASQKILGDTKHNSGQNIYNKSIKISMR